MATRCPQPTRCGALARTRPRACPASDPGADRRIGHTSKTFPPPLLSFAPIAAPSHLLPLRFDVAGWAGYGQPDGRCRWWRFHENEASPPYLPRGAGKGGAHRPTLVTGWRQRTRTPPAGRTPRLGALGLGELQTAAACSFGLVLAFAAPFVPFPPLPLRVFGLFLHRSPCFQGLLPIPLHRRWERWQGGIRDS